VAVVLRFGRRRMRRVDDGVRLFFGRSALAGQFGKELA
jgi:hypothetical protein